MTPLNPKTSIKKTGVLITVLLFSLFALVLYAVLTLVAGLSDRQGVRKAMAIRLGVWSAWWGRARHPFTTPVMKVPSVCQTKCDCGTTTAAAATPNQGSGPGSSTDTEARALELELKSMGIADVGGLK